MASRASAAEPTDSQKSIEIHKKMVAAAPAPAPAETWPPSPPTGQQQRGYFSEMLQYGLSREDVTSSSVYTAEEPKTRPPVPASTYTGSGAAPVSNAITLSLIHI